MFLVAHVSGDAISFFCQKIIGHSQQVTQSPDTKWLETQKGKVLESSNSAVKPERLVKVVARAIQLKLSAPRFNQSCHCKVMSRTRFSSEMCRHIEQFYINLTPLVCVTATKIALVYVLKFPMFYVQMNGYILVIYYQ